MSAKIVASTENMSYEDWLEHRKLGVGGSDASVVCGINRYKSPVELWMEKTNQLPAQEAGEATYWGTQLEAIVRAEFTKRTGIEVNQVKQLLQCEEHPFMLANLDGVCEHPDLALSSLKPRPPPLTKPVSGRIPSRTSICARFSIIWLSLGTREPISLS